MTASVDYDTTIRCDEPGCRATFRLPSSWEYTRKQAARAGWVYVVIRGDFCPEHAALDRKEDQQ